MVSARSGLSTRFSLSWESRQRLPRRPSAPRSSREAQDAVTVLTAVITALLQDSASSGRTGRHWDRYGRGSADAARSRATAPATTRAEPAAVLGLRRRTARGTRRAWNTASQASPAIAPTVSRRGWRRPDRTPKTIWLVGPM